MIKSYLKILNDPHICTNFLKSIVSIITSPITWLSHEIRQIIHTIIDNLYDTVHPISKYFLDINIAIMGSEIFYMRCLHIQSKYVALEEAKNYLCCVLFIIRNSPYDYV